MNRIDLAVGVLDLLEHGLEALLELAAELGAGDERAEVERDDALVLEALGDVAADDPLGEALGDGRLADAGLADEHRVVLGPPAEHLDDAPDLLVAADDRIELARAGLRGQVAAVLLERLVRALGVLGRDALAAADALERLEQGLVAGGVALEQGLRLAPGLGDAEEQVLGRDVLVAEATGLGLGTIDDGLGARVERQRAALDPGALGQRRGELATEPGRSTPRRRSVSAGMPSSGSTRALSRCSASRIGLWSRWAVSWAATMASWAFWVKRSSCRSQVSRVRGSGWSARSMKVRAASRASSDRSVGQDDLDSHEQVAVALLLELGQAAAAQPEQATVLGAGRDRQQDAALRRASPGPRRRGAPRRA